MKERPAKRKITVDRIHMTLGKKELTLSPEEARDLHAELGKLLGRDSCGCNHWYPYNNLQFTFNDASPVSDHITLSPPFEKTVCFNGPPGNGDTVFDANSLQLKS